VPDPDSVIQRFRPEFEKFVYLALMGGWEDGELRPQDAEALLLPDAAALETSGG
jgi:diacylglycerol O-acyltransferase